MPGKVVSVFRRKRRKCEQKIDQETLRKTFENIFNISDDLKNLIIIYYRMFLPLQTLYGQFMDGSLLSNHKVVLLGYNLNQNTTHLVLSVNIINICDLG